MGFLNHKATVETHVKDRQNLLQQTLKQTVYAYEHFKVGQGPQS